MAREGKQKNISPTIAPAPGRPKLPRIAGTARRLGRMIPEEELRRIPKDLSSQIDHYVYGSPKTLRRVFADTLTLARGFSARPDAAYGVDLSKTLLVTTEDVLSEFLAAATAIKREGWRADWSGTPLIGCRKRSSTAPNAGETACATKVYK